jgi:hypothetical protein
MGRTSVGLVAIVLVVACESTRSAPAPGHPGAGPADSEALPASGTDPAAADAGSTEVQPLGLPPATAPPNEPRNREAPPKTVIPEQYPPGELPAR